MPDTNSSSSFSSVMNNVGAAGAAAGGIGGLVDSLVNAFRGQNWYRKQQEASADIQYKYQQMAADEEQRRQMEMWQQTFDATNRYNRENDEYWFDKQNEYNSPSALRSRLEQAGMSKAAMFSNGSLGMPATGSAGTAAGGGMSGSFSGGMPNVGSPSTPWGTSFGNFGNAFEQAARIANLNSNTDKTNAEVVSVEMFNALQEVINPIKIENEKLGNQLLQISQQIANATKESDISIRKNTARQSFYESLKAAEAWEEYNRKNKIGRKYDEKIAERSFYQMGVQIGLLSSQIQLNAQQGAYLSIMASKAALEGRLLNLEYGYKDEILSTQLKQLKTNLGLSENDLMRSGLDLKNYKKDRTINQVIQGVNAASGLIGSVSKFFMPSFGGSKPSDYSEWFHTDDNGSTYRHRQYH